MGTVLGEAKIKVTLDTESAKRDIQKLGDPGEWSYDPNLSDGDNVNAKHAHRNKVARWKAQQRKARAAQNAGSATLGTGAGAGGTTGNAPLGHAGGGGLGGAQARMAAANAAQQSNLQILQGAVAVTKAAIAAKLVKEVIDDIESSPKFLSFLAGAFPKVFPKQSETLNHLSNEITLIKTTLEAYGKTKDETFELGRSALRLGQHPTVGGALDIWSFLLNLNQRADFMQRRVDKELDKDIMGTLGEAARIAINR